MEQAVHLHADVVELMAEGLSSQQAKVLDEIMSRAEENLDIALAR